MLILRLAFFAVLLGIAGFVGYGSGYLTAQDNSSTLARYSKRALDRVNELQGKPSQAEQKIARIESTFIRFAGELHSLPQTDYINGGALTVWDEEHLILVTRGGRLLTFTQEDGLRDMPVQVPDNGVAGYTELSKLPEYENFLHKIYTIRYNDILYVDRPDFHGFLLSYSFFDVDRVCGGSRIARLDLPRTIEDPSQLSANAEDWRVIFETTPCLELDPNWTAFDGIMAGGRMDLMSDGRLVYGSGEYHRDGIHTKDLGIQEPDNSYGKILAIDIDTGAVETLAMGHRNVQGVTVDRDGEIWTIEHAIRGGDELNHIRPGENHGWPDVSLGTLYSGQPLPVIGVEGRHEGYDLPAFAFLPSAGTSALTSIDNFHPAWDGGLLAGSLSSPEFGQSLYHIRTEGERVVFVERIKLERRVRYVQQWGDKIAMWLDPTDLLILRMDERKDPLGSAITAMEAEFPEEVFRQARNTLNKCAECHSFEEGNHNGAPSMNGVVGRNVAGAEYGFYSDALANLGGVWTEERLKQFLVAPETIAPDSYMPAQGLSEGPVLDAVIWGLIEADTTDDEHMKY